LKRQKKFFISVVGNYSAWGNEFPAEIQNKKQPKNVYITRNTLFYSIFDI